MRNKKVPIIFIFSLIILVGIFSVFALSTTTNLSQRGSGVSELSFFDGEEVAHLASPKIIDATVHEGRVNIIFDTPITLNDLEAISWDAYVTQGYIPHVDIFLDNGEVLVFEYDKITTPSDQLLADMNFQRNAWVNTFDDKGIVNENARVWLSSGAPGGLNSPNFVDALLSEWKVGNVGTNLNNDADSDLITKADSIDGSTLVTHLEIEVDGWVAESEAYVDNIRVNSEIVETFDEAPIIANVFIEPEFPNLNSTLVKVFASITDDISGVDFADLFWRVEGDNTINTATFTGPFSGGQAGIFIGEPKDGVIIEYHIKAVDNSGNTAWDPSINTFHTFAYDGSTPTTTDGASTGWTNQDVTVTLTCEDTISGCKETFYSTNGSEPSLLYSSPFTLSDTGEHQLTYFSMDNAGNQENVVTGTLVQIDKEVPTIIDDYANDSIWVNSPQQTVTLTPSDTGGSGISSILTCEGSDCTPSNSLVSPYQLFFSASQDTIVRYQTFDVAENPSAIEEFNVKIDLVTPVTTDNVPADWQNTSFDVTLSVAIDSLSPTTTNHKFWRDDQTEPLNFSQGNLINVNVDGEYNLKYFSEDEAENVETEIVALNLARLDTINPTVSVNGDLPEEWVNESVDLNVSCTDSLSECSESTFKIKTVPEGADCSSVDFSGAGSSLTVSSHSYVCAKASDNAGNTGFSEIAEVLVDLQSPSATITSNSSTDKMDYFIVKADVSDAGGSELESVVLTLKQGENVIQGLENVPMTLVLNEDYEYLLRMWELVAENYTLEVTATDNAGNVNVAFQTFEVRENVAPSRITSTNNHVNATTGGTVSFNFDVVVRNSGSIIFGIDDVAGLSPHSLNATVSNGTTNVSVGRGIDFIGAGVLDLVDLDTETPNVQGTFTLYLDIPEAVIPGSYPINYFIDVA